MILQMLTKRQSIIVLNGAIDTSLFNCVHCHVPIIAADGAAEKLHSLGFPSDFIVGDGDSYNGHRHPQRIIIEEQNSTDFEKCIHFAAKHHLLPNLVVGISGGEIDHILGNMQALIKHAQHQNLYFLDTYIHPKTLSHGTKLGVPLHNECFSLKLETRCTISLLPFGQVLVSTKGLNWEIHKARLSTGVNASLRNYNKEQEIEIDVLRGKIMLIIDITSELNA